MSRFALFLFDECEPSGGVNDLALIGSLDECIGRAEQSDHEKVAQVVTMDTLKVVKYGGWAYTPLDQITGLTADVGKIVWKYQWVEAP
jgi:hypothetical protein